MLAKVQESVRRVVTNARPAPLSLHEFSVEVPGLSTAHDGIRVAHLSDLHVGWATSPRRIREAIALVHASKPDLVAMTGDYICLSRLDIAPMKRALEGLRSVPVPVLATLGNHDFWAGPERVASALGQVGISVLRNGSRALRIRGEELWVVGVDDPVSKAEDVAASFDGVPDSAHVPLALVHCGRAAGAIAEAGAGLILSGHSHGGQVEIPGVTDRLGQRMGIPHMRGMHQVGDAMLYVTPGIGNSAIPFRVGQGAQPEVALITLRCAR